MKCVKCGNEYSNGKFCSACGAKIMDTEEIPSIDKSQVPDVLKEDDDPYLNELKSKKEFAEIADGVVGLLILIFCGFVIKNNWGYRSIAEIVIICLIIIVVICAIYSAFAAGAGIYNASENLEKYIKLKEEIGRVEAIKIMEQTANQKEGYNLLKIGIGGVFGFVITILLFIIVISLF